MFSSCLKLEDLPKKLKFMKDFNRTWDYLLMSSNLLSYRGTKYHDYIREKGLELPSDELSSIIPYIYEDPRIQNISNEMGNLKVKCPEVILLHNLLYDSMNILCRYHNKMNKHLWRREDIFLKFKEELEKILESVGETYFRYFSELIELAEAGWSSDKADLLYQKYIPPFFPETYKMAKEIIRSLIDSFNAAGLSTSKLYLKTWMSISNSQINTSGGKIEK
jgi:hypothetical protein